MCSGIFLAGRWEGEGRQAEGEEREIKDEEIEDRGRG